MGLTAVTVLIVGPTFGLFQSYKERLELQKYGVWTKSVVIDKKHNTQKVPSSQDYLIKCRYRIIGINYETLYHNDINNSHLIGDTIRIIYSKQFPKIYALDYELKK